MIPRIFRNQNLVAARIQPLTAEVLPPDLPENTMTNLDKITEIIVKTANCNAADVTPEASLVALGVDSLKALTVLFELEEAFDIEIPNELIPSIETVNDILVRLEDAKQ